MAAEDPQERIWHDADCPARHVSSVPDDRDIAEACDCPPERWLDPWAKPDVAAEP